ncbi:MAG: hypothetical protein QXP42_06055 [Candidatus Micrarchaeia archaeon]
MDRAQSAVEYLVIFGVVVLAFVVLLALFTSDAMRDARMQTKGIAEELGFQVAEEIDNAVRAGDGYMRNFTIPSRAEGFMTYTLVINTLSGSVDIYYEENQSDISLPILTKNITVSPTNFAYLQNGTEYGYTLNNTLRNIFIRNRNGTIEIYQSS